MEELFDKELRGMVKFTDATQQQAAATQQQKAAGKPAAAMKNVQQQKKPTQRPEAMDGGWEPVKGEPTYIERLKACVKWCALFGGLSVLLFYWQQTGQMEASAAVPSMCACTLLAGVGIGKNWKWK